MIGYKRIIDFNSCSFRNWKERHLVWQPAVMRAKQLSWRLSEPDFFWLSTDFHNFHVDE
jgi:hypothetical protein